MPVKHNLSVQSTSVNMISVKTEIREHLLAWYDDNQRVLPWRAENGETPNPYYVYLSEVMLQQTTVATGKTYFQKFIKKWPTLKSLAEASLDEILIEWQGLGYYSRARNLHKAVKSLANMETFPKVPKDLNLLPGIGDYTSAAVASIAFDYPIIPVDGNIMRVFARMFTIPFSLPKLKDEVTQMAKFIACKNRSGDFAQALMDLGALICRPKVPQCNVCPLNAICKAYQQQRASEFPISKLKKEKPIRYGIAYILVNDNKILLEKRPEKGLLGGMVGVPTTPWEQVQINKTDSFEPESGIEWQNLPQPVKHTFTHFYLYLSIKIGISKQPPKGLWVAFDKLDAIALPTVMKKIIQKYLILN